MMTPHRQWRGLPIAAAVACAGLLAGLVFSHVEIRTDMTDFLPRGRSDAARLMLEELRTGATTTLVTLGIEGVPPDALARVSRDMANALERSGQFAFVNNGGGDLAGSADQQFLFSYRYLLSSVTSPEAFTVPALREDMRRLLRGLQSSAAPLLQQFGARDPPGAFLAIARDWIGASKVRKVDGVWFAPERDRALILARTRAGGLDIAGQDAADGAIRQAFADSNPGNSRLLAAGPAIFTREAAHAMRSDVETLSIASTVLIAVMLLWRFRSPWVLGVIAVPMVLGITAAALVVQLVYGFVHGVAVGFGMTMLGVTVDYPVLLVGHRKQGEAAPATLRRIARTFTLSVLTAALGLTGMLFSGLPGLSQLGCFSVVGILVAASVTRWLLPRLIVAADLAPVAAGDPTRLLRIEHLRDWRVLGVGACVIAAAGLLAVGGPRWESELAALSPVPRAALALDAELRGELGAPDAASFAVVRDTDAEAVLRKEETLLPRLDALISEGVLGSAEIAARYLPSTATQLARRAVLPSPDELTTRVAVAQEGLPFRAGAFQAFIDDVAASRTMPPLVPSDVTSKLIAARLQPLLFQRGSGWYGVIAPSDLHQPEQFASAMRGAGVTFVDVTEESNAIVAEYTGTAWRWLALGALAALVAISLGLRETLRVVRVAGAIAGALLVTVAILTASNVRLSLIHIVSLQFVAGVGLDYALFFARRQLDGEERARTLRTLATCNAMTVLTFGLLALCRTPLLRQIGLTVVIGALAAFVFAFLFAGQRPRTMAEFA
jgi:predicted exporter